MNSVRAYAGVCNSPGINRHSYVYRLSAVSSSCAHCRNQLASPLRRVRCFAAARITPNASSTLSARSTKSGGGRRRPCSMEATVSGEYPTSGANCSCVSLARLRKVLTTSPNILRMYCGSGSPPRPPPLPKVPYVVLSMPSVPCVMYGHLPVRLSWSETRPCSRNVTRTVHPSRPYAD
ncbi:hypothetical protein SBADM41S_04574 [Streptomyces badius]